MRVCRIIHSSATGICRPATCCLRPFLSIRSSSHPSEAISPSSVTLSKQPVSLGLWAWLLEALSRHSSLSIPAAFPRLISFSYLPPKFFSLPTFQHPACFSLQAHSFWILHRVGR